MGGYLLRIRRESSKADGSRVRAEDGVDVLEERVSNDPCRSDAVGAACEREDGPETLGARLLLQFEIGRRDGPGLTAKRERDVDGGRAG